tara:strand:- start:2677 stop:3564 length:888 start_codon:yes stop_codon:yes gene_type:complete
MRRTGGSSKPDWVGIDGQVVGIQLGADFCAEHEFGIKDMKRSLGIMDRDEAKKKKVFGLPRYRIGEVNPDHFLFVETKTTHEAILIYNPTILGSSWNSNYAEKLRALNVKQLADKHDIHFFKPWRDDEEPQTLATAWDGSSFGIHVKGEQPHAWLKELHQAFLNGDAVIYLGQPPIPAFSNSSLNLMIASRIPQEGLDTMEQADREQWELERDAEKTGIAKKLEKAGLRYYSLKPSRGVLEDRVSHGKTPPTKYDLMFWLNPREQDIHNHGWFTVEELEQWIEGKGPVPKKETTS